MSLTSRDGEGTLARDSTAREPVEGGPKGKVDEFYAALRLAIKLGTELGTPTNALAEILKELDHAVEGGDSPLVLSLCEARAPQLASASENIFEKVKDKLVEARNLRINIDEQLQILKRSLQHLNSGRILEALKLMEDCDSKTTRSVHQHTETWSVILTTANLLSEANKKEIDTGSALEALIKAKGAFERQEYGAAMELASGVRAETESRMTLHTSALNIAAARKALEVAARLGLDVADATAGLEGAKEAVKRGSQNEALKLSTERRDAIEKDVANEIGNSLSRSETVFDMLTEVPLAPQQRALDMAKGYLEKRQWRESCDLAIALRDDLRRLLEKKEASGSAIEKCRRIFKEAGAMKIETPEAEKLLQRAEEEARLGMFGASIATVENAMTELQKEKDSGVDVRIKDAQSVMDKAKRDGVDTRSAERLMEMSRQQLKKGNHRQALALAAQSRIEIDRIGLAQQNATKAISAAEKKLGEMGGPMPGAAELISAAQGAFEEGDYERARGLAAMASKELDDYHELLKKTLKTRARAEGIAEVANRIGADTTSLEGILGEAVAAEAAGDLRAARDSYNRCLGWGSGLCRSHIEGLLHDATDRTVKLKRLGLDDATAVKMLVELNARLDSGDFDAALELIPKASTEATDETTPIADETSTSMEATSQQEGNLENEVADELLYQTPDPPKAELAETKPQPDTDQIEASDPAEDRETEFTELSGLADTTIRYARKFGIKVDEAARTLADALELAEKDISGAMEKAKKAHRLALEAMEDFAPRAKANLDVPKSIVGEQVDGSLTIINEGKSLAKEVRVEILGEAKVEGLQEIPNLRAKGENKLPIKVTMTAGGSVTLTIRTTARSMLGKEYSQETVVQVEVEKKIEPPSPLLAEKDGKCTACRGSIKIGFRIKRCSACGAECHETCASRAGACPSCREPFPASS